MRAFSIIGRSLVNLYEELFLLVGGSLLWWLTGGFLVGLTALVGWTWWQTDGPVWLLPLLVIPAGPAGAALAHLVRPVARRRHADGSLFWEGWRTYWRRALGLNAISMTLLALLLLNLQFYGAREGVLPQFLTIFWIYVTAVWTAMQLHLFPMLVGLIQPSIPMALRLAVLLPLAHPLYSLVLLVLVAALTAISTALPIILVLAWPALVMLVGEHSVIELTGAKPSEGNESPGEEEA